MTKSLFSTCNKLVTMVSKYKEADKAKNWMQSVLNTFEKDTGKTLNEWVEIAKTCPETQQRKQLKWFKEEYGLLQNRAMMVLSKAFPGATPLWGNPEKLVDELFKKYPEQRALYEDVTDYMVHLEEEVSLSPRKTYVPAVCKKQFAVLLPSKEGLIVGFALKDEPVTEKLMEPKRPIGSERITRYVVLQSETDFDAEVKTYIDKAAALNS